VIEGRASSPNDIGKLQHLLQIT